MIKSISEKNPERSIDLTGPDGNAFELLGYAKNLAQDLDYSKDEIEDLLNAMRKSDYENLINTFDAEFGEFVTLYR